MNKSKPDDGYEIIPIRPATQEERDRIARITVIESPWVTVHNGITGEYFQYHRETGERRNVPVDWWEG